MHGRRVVHTSDFVPFEGQTVFGNRSKGLTDNSVGYVRYRPQRTSYAIIGMLPLKNTYCSGVYIKSSEAEVTYPTVMKEL